MEENFSMEWKKIAGMEWKKIAALEYGKIVFHTMPDNRDVQKIAHPALIYSCAS